MPLSEPPREAGSLAGTPARPLAGTALYRVWRRHLPDGSTREVPWWFASAPEPPEDGGRFDLAEPNGTCYLATTLVGSLLEALQLHLAHLPRAELAVRAAVEAMASDHAPEAADLTARQNAGSGITAGLWAGSDRVRTQAWAAAFRRDGWWALHAGIQHDPSGGLRSIALFDYAGAHPPSHGGQWPTRECDLMTSDLEDELARFGVRVRGPANLPIAEPPPRS